MICTNVIEYMNWKDQLFHAKNVEMVKISGTNRGQLSVVKPENMIFVQTEKKVSNQQPNQPKVIYIKQGAYWDVKYSRTTIFSTT